MYSRNADHNNNLDYTPEKTEAPPPPCTYSLSPFQNNYDLTNKIIFQLTQLDTKNHNL